MIDGSKLKCSGVLHRKGLLINTVLACMVCVRNDDMIDDTFDERSRKVWASFSP